MTETATSNQQDTRSEIEQFLTQQAGNELLPDVRRTDYALAADLLREDESVTRDWPAARAFIIRMTEGLL